MVAGGAVARMSARASPATKVVGLVAAGIVVVDGGAHGRLRG